MLYGIVVNMLIHSVVILAFLTAFYNFFVLKIEKDAYMNSINSVVDTVTREYKASHADTFTTFKRQLPVNLTGQFIDGIPAGIVVPPDAEAALNNEYLNILIITITALLAVFAIGLAVLPFFACRGIRLDLVSIIVKILVVAAVTGYAEYYAFANIITKYIPVSSSQVASSFNDQLVQSLSG